MTLSKRPSKLTPVSCDVSSYANVRIFFNTKLFSTARTHSERDRERKKKGQLTSFYILLSGAMTSLAQRRVYEINIDYISFHS